MGALLARFVASAARRSRRSSCWSAVGALFGSSVLDVVDVPFDSLGAQLIFTLGVSLILFYGGLSPVAADAARACGCRSACSPCRACVLTALVVGVDGALRVRPAVGHGTPRRRGAVADRSGDPDPAVRALAAEAEGGADGDRRVGLQRPDRRGARAHPGRRRAHRERLGRRPGKRLPRRPRHQHGDRDRGRGRARGGDLEPPLRASGARARRSRCSPWSRSASSRSTPPAAAATWARSWPG